MEHSLLEAQTKTQKFNLKTEGNILRLPENEFILQNSFD
jgi:hypothetical protein